MKLYGILVLFVGMCRAAHDLPLTGVAMAQWQVRLEAIETVLQTLLRRIDSDFYRPAQNKEVVLAWVRDTLRNVHQYRKTYQGIELNVHYERMRRYVHMIHEVLVHDCTQLPDGDIAKIAISHASVPYAEADALLEKEYEALKEKVETSGLNFVRYAARALESVVDWLHSKTDFYAWYHLLPYAPAALIFLRHLVPLRVQALIARCYIAVPVWHVGISPYGIPIVDVQNALAVTGFLGRGEILYGNFVKTYFLIQLAKRFLDTHTQELVNTFPAEAGKIMQRWWQSLRGVPVTTEVRYDIIDDKDLDDPSLVGLEEQRAQLKEIAAYVIDPESYLSRGFSIEKGILLTGPSRTGKTLLAQALAGTINKELQKRGRPHAMAFIEIKFDEVKKWKSQEAFEGLIAEVRAHAPCILFLDELHTYGLQTTGDSGLYNTMLTVLNKLHISRDPHDQIFIIGATNRPDLIAQELRSPKRFGREIRFTLPDFAQRRYFFSRRLVEELALDETALALDSYARQTINCSYGQLQMVLDRAKFLGGTQTVSHASVQAAIDAEVHHFVDVIALSDEERRTVAAHLAGHVYMLQMLAVPLVLEFVTMRAWHRPIKETFEWQQNKSLYQPSEQFKREYGKLVTYNPHEALDITGMHEREKWVKVLLAGALAEDILLGDHTGSYHVSDKAEAFMILKAFFLDGVKLCEKESAEFSFVEKPGKLVGICALAEKKAYERLAEYEQEVRACLNEHKQLLELVAHELCARDTLAACDIAQLLNG